MFHKLNYNKENKRDYYAPSANVRHFLELNPSPIGPLDATEILNQVTFVLELYNINFIHNHRAFLMQLTNDELCDFFGRYPECESLIIKDWVDIDSAVLRAISVSVIDATTKYYFSLIILYW